MSIYAIADLHLSFGTNKPMEIFGSNWENHTEKIRKNWEETVKQDDLVLLPGDFSWAMYLSDTYQDFAFLNSLPGRKILLKGNHDYWWSTLASMYRYLEENNFKNIDFLQNNSYEYENYIIAGTRGWSTLDCEDNKKILKRENIRLELSLQDGIKKYGEEKRIIACMHYPPAPEFIETMKKYNVTQCIYGHLHGPSHKDRIEGIKQGINFKLVSSDYLDFKLCPIGDSPFWDKMS